jgi:hypothetical protein
VIVLEFLRDIVPARPFLGFVAPYEQALHVIAVRYQNRAIVGRGKRRFREPPHVLDTVLDPAAAHIDPFGRSRKLGEIEPEAFLRQVEADPFAQRDRQLKVIERAGRLGGIAAAADIENEAPSALRTRRISRANGSSQPT